MLAWLDGFRHDELEADFAQYYHLDLERMGDEYSHAHAACLAAQLPKGSRCRAALDPHDEWDEGTWMLWHIYRRVNQLRWGFVKADGEDQPKALPYPGQERDRDAARRRFEVSKAAVDAAFGMDGGKHGD